MGHLFRINPQGGNPNSTIEDWSNSSVTPYDKSFVDRIADATTTQKEITSIPSPFARIELVKESFGKIVRGSINGMLPDDVKKLLHGKSIYHKMVSDSLDVAQIFFSYPQMKDKFDIIVWDKEEQIKQLLASPTPEHQIVGKTLQMFLDQDAKGSDPYNFGKMKNLYILKYKGIGQRQMHIVGATSPATLFFSTANDENSISQQVCFGTDYAFDDKFSSLDQRDPEFIKYLFALKYSQPQFSQWYPEVDKYMDAVYYVLNNDLKNKINDIQNTIMNSQSGISSYIDSTYDPISFSVKKDSIYQVEVNGQPIHYKKTEISGNSDFEIQCSKRIAGNAPLVLPVTNGNVYASWIYYGSEFGRNFKVPAYDDRPLLQRTLPGINIQYPYLTISDFLEDKILLLPSEINKGDYFDGNFYSNSGQTQGYMLPISERYFDYFKVSDLMGNAPSGKKTIEIKTVASGVEVTLRIPIKNGKEVEYKRIYTLDVHANQKNNEGAVVTAPEDFVVGVFPPIQFTNEDDANYRIALLSDFALNVQCSCSCYNEGKGFFTPPYVVRNIDINEDIRSKVYLLEKTSFDCLRVNVITDVPGSEMRATGLIVPKFKKRAGTGSFTFAIDLGTSNTHIEYIDGPGQMPKPFEFSEADHQMSLLFKPSDTIKNHIRGEFIPEMIGDGCQCQFPMRTVLCIDRNNSGIDESGTGSYAAFGNASPAFMYNKTDVGPKYNSYIPNLKWSELNYTNEERIRCYIESLFLMIRAKVLLSGGSLAQTQIKWFYPISMSNNKRGLFERVWNAAYQKYFNTTNTPIAITESIAPYSYFQKTMASVTNIVTVDIGGGTTDIVVADTHDVKCITSMRFAADAIFGNSLVAVQNGPLNGIIKQFKDDFINNLSGLDDLQKMLKEKTANNYGNSSEVASFLFSLAENEQVVKKHLVDKVDFNSALKTDGKQKIVFYVFYTAIMYHLANLMKAKNLSVPANIAFSGNGSKVISVLGSQQSLELLTTKIFEMVYQTDIKNINLIINSRNPKEATCKGGLFLAQLPANVMGSKTVLLGTNTSILVNEQKYSEAQSMYPDVIKEVKSFMDFITLRLPKRVSLSNEFGIEKQYLQLAVDCFNKDLMPYIEKGVDMKLTSNDVSKDDVIEESMFFYPIIGVINDLSEQICNIQ